VVTHIPDSGMRCIKGKRAATRGGAALYRLVLLFPSFFPAAFARQCFLHALLLARLQIKGVALNLLNDVFLLHLALETAQCILKGLALLQSEAGREEAREGSIGAQTQPEKSSERARLIDTGPLLPGWRPSSLYAAHSRVWDMRNHGVSAVFAQQ